MCAFFLSSSQCSFFLCAHSKEKPCCGSPEETFILLQSLPFKRHLHGEHKEHPLAPTRSRQRQRCDPVSVLLPQSQLLRAFCLYCIPLISCGRLCLTQIPFLSFSSDCDCTARGGGRGTEEGRQDFQSCRDLPVLTVVLISFTAGHPLRHGFQEQLLGQPVAGSGVAF